MSDSRMMVMVCSLERHLEEERKVVNEAIYGQGAFPVGLPYPAIPANYILKLNNNVLADADYVFLLVGAEYGALTDKGVGYIHATFAAAQAARKPIIAMIYNGPVTRKTDAFDQKRLQGLLEVLKSSMTYYWKDADSLRDQTEMALEHALEQHPALGWVRSNLEPLIPTGNQADQTLIYKLKQQVSSLSQKLQSSSRSSEGSVEVIDFKKDARNWSAGYQCNAFREGRLKQMDGSLDYSLTTIFEWLAPTLLAPVTESRLRAVISSRIHPEILTSAKKQWPGCHAVSDVKIEQMSFDDLKVRFRALGIVGFDQHGRWQLTEGGEKLALQKELTN